MTPNAANQRVLLVDDEPDLHELLLFNLTEAGFSARAESTGEAGLRTAASFRPDVVVLDVMLPDISGIEACRRLRQDPLTEDVGILMLTARGEELDRVIGLEAGADDYVVKPFSVREIVLRVRALGRRTRELRLARSAPRAGRLATWQGLTVDLGRQQVFIDGSEVKLRPLEYKLVAVFVDHPDKTWSRAELLSEVWGMDGEVQTRTVDTHVRRLRERLGRYGAAVETVQGLGYRLRATEP
jgi:two-component system, OmpR family, phosphate regulon response regulator PhoB